MTSTPRKRRSRNAKKTVLIVDDEPMICETLGTLLSRRGLVFKQALTGKEAIESIEKREAGLVILDFSLPDMDGLKVLEKIRDLEPDIPVIFMTGYGSETVSIRAFKLGISDYFIKPFHPRSLVDKAARLAGIKDDEADDYKDETSIPKKIENTSEIAKAVEHMKKNYSSKISLKEISDIAGISKFHFTRSFKKVMNMSFSDYLNHLRVRKAEEFLYSNTANISSVAYKNGFSSLRQFERSFKKVTGKTPMQFRRDNS
ncbi:MAG: response regulator transcription factor [Proteobacteria bacterium]|nr:response regulator transcription factor [Pseudomonadota bacterium]